MNCLQPFVWCINLLITQIFFLDANLKIYYIQLQSTQDIKPSTQASHEPKTEQQNNQTTDAPLADSGSVSASSNDGRKVSRQDIELV